MVIAGIVRQRFCY